MSSNIVLELNNVSVGYVNGNKQNILFDNLSFTFNKNEFITILGKSGIGKTTILKTIMGLNKLLSGEISINGDVSILFQDIRLFPHMNVIENVTYPLKIKKVDKKERELKTCKLLEELGVYDKRYANVNVLSGGEAQRVGFARSIITDPAILLLDEPFSSLDTKIKGNTRKLIKQIKQNHDLTVIMVTHDIVDAMLLSDRIIILEEKNVLGDYKISDIRNSEIAKEYLNAFFDEYKEIEKIIKG